MARSTIAAQLYTVREFLKTPADIAKTLKKIRAIGYEAVQASGLGPIEPKELRAITDGEGLKICATHSAHERMRDETEVVIGEHNILGCDHMAVGSMPLEFGGSAEGFTRFAKELDEIGRRIVAAGKTFSYHNHDFEFERFNGRLGLDIIFSETDKGHVFSELDTYWVAHGGGSPVQWIEKLAGRLRLLHLKDAIRLDGKLTYAEVGEGNLDWPGILKAAAKAGVEWYIVEQDTCRRDPFESLKISLENLRGMGVN